MRPTIWWKEFRFVPMPCWPAPVVTTALGKYIVHTHTNNSQRHMVQGVRDVPPASQPANLGYPGTWCGKRPRRESPSLSSWRHSPCTHIHGSIGRHGRTGWRLRGSIDWKGLYSLPTRTYISAHAPPPPGASCGSFWQGRCRITLGMRGGGGATALKRARARLFSETCTTSFHAPSD